MKILHSNHAKILPIIKGIAIEKRMTFSSLLDVGSGLRTHDKWFKKFELSIGPKEYYAVDSDQNIIEQLNAKGISTINPFEEDKKCDYMALCSAYVVHNDGQTVRGNLYTQASSWNEMDESYENRGANVTVSNVTHQNGDRLVFEFGFQSGNSKSTTYAGGFQIGDSSGTDLPENETETSPYNPWVELETDLTFQTLSDYVPKVIIF